MSRAQNCWQGPRCSLALRFIAGCRLEPPVGTRPSLSCRCKQGLARVGCSDQGRSAGDRDLGWRGRQGPGGCGCHPREGLPPPPDTLVEISGNRGSCPGAQRQNAAHLFATHSIIINTRVVIKGRALIKYSCAGENAPPGDMGSLTSSGANPGASQRKFLILSCDQND